MTPVIAVFWHFFVLVLSNAVLVLVIDAREWTRQRFRDTIDRDHGRIGIPSLLPHFEHEHEHRFTEHEHDNCV